MVLGASGNAVSLTGSSRHYHVVDDPGLVFLNLSGGFIAPMKKEESDNNSWVKSVPSLHVKLYNIYASPVLTTT